MHNQSDAKLKMIFEYSLIKSLKKNEIPTTPRIINKTSEIEQKRAI
jgi:hypothetical protein